MKYLQLVVGTDPYNWDLAVVHSQYSNPTPSRIESFKKSALAVLKEDGRAWSKVILLEITHDTPVTVLEEHFFPGAKKELVELNSAAKPAPKKIVKPRTSVIHDQAVVDFFFDEGQ